MSKTPEQIRAIVEELKVLYPDSLCSLEYEKDYELLFSVRLAAQCTDERVNKVTPALFKRFPTLESLAERLGVKNATLMWPVRIAAAGQAVTPGGAVEICRILGREETLRRLRLGLDQL